MSGNTPDGDELWERAARLVAIPRALTGDGMRRVLDEVAEWVPALERVEVATGTPVLDWTVPEEWNLRRATLTRPDGEVVADSDVHPLHVVGYSEPVDRHLTLDELEDGHLHSLPDAPDVIPWRTSYYARTWGFCLTDAERRSLPDGRYHARVDASLAPGHLTYAEAVIPGQQPDEILITAHTCHPAMANDNASGVVVAAALAEWLADRPRRLTYRFLFAPGTIGAITWLAQHPDVVPRVVGGLVLSGVGDPGPRWTYKRSRRGDAPIDRAMALALRDRDAPHVAEDYEPWGYDERQFNSLGYDLGVGLLNRTKHGTYPEYHTSADDLSFLRPERLAEARDVLVDVVGILERDGRYRSEQPYGEPQLGRRGLYPSVGGQRGRRAQMAMLWVLAMADGHTSLVDIASRSDLPFAEIADAAERLAETDLLTRMA